METTEFDTTSIITRYMGKAYKSLLNVTIPPNTKSYTTMIMFSKTDVHLSEEIRLNNISDFISSVGGNLGLFIGFSFLSMLLQLTEWARKIHVKSLFQ